LTTWLFTGKILQETDILLISVPLAFEISYQSLKSRPDPWKLSNRKWQILLIISHLEQGSQKGADPGARAVIIADLRW